MGLYKLFWFKKQYICRYNLKAKSSQLRVRRVYIYIHNQFNDVCKKCEWTIPASAHPPKYKSISMILIELTITFRVIAYLQPCVKNTSEKNVTKPNDSMSNFVSVPLPPKLYFLNDIFFLFSFLNNKMYLCKLQIYNHNVNTIILLSRTWSYIVFL